MSGQSVTIELDKRGRTNLCHAGAAELPPHASANASASSLRVCVSQSVMFMSFRFSFDVL